MNNKNNARVFAYSFESIYRLYVAKIERKGRNTEELNTVLRWLTGYDDDTLQEQMNNKNDLEAFFAQAPMLNPNVTLITGMICGYRIEEIEDELMRKIRYMDKLVDELAKGRAMEKILRK